MGDEYFMFHNITTMGPKFHRWRPSENCIGLGIAEHHLMKHELPPPATNMHRKGWNVWWTPAFPTGRGGSRAGTAIALRSHIQASRFDMADMDASHLPKEHKLYTIIKVRIGSLAFVWASLYLPPDHAFEGMAGQHKG